jgi:hypothetical protein
MDGEEELWDGEAKRADGRAARRSDLLEAGVFAVGDLFLMAYRNVGHLAGLYTDAAARGDVGSAGERCGGRDRGHP